MRAAVISATGTGAKRTIPALVNSEIVSISAIHGRDPDRLVAVADEYSITHVYTDLASLIGEGQFDFAIVCSPPFLHADQVPELLTAGIPCLVEKPLGISAPEVAKLGASARDMGIALRVAHHLRFTPMFEVVKRLVADGQLGVPHTASMEWSFKLNRTARNAAWKLNPLLNGPSCISDAGVHCIDAAVALFGPGRVESVVCKTEKARPMVEELVVVSTHDETTVTTTSSWLYGPFSNALRVAGSEAQD